MDYKKGYALHDLLRHVSDGDLPEGDYESDHSLIHVYKDQVNFYYGTIRINEMFKYIPDDNASLDRVGKMLG